MVGLAGSARAGPRRAGYIAGPFGAGVVVNDWQMPSTAQGGTVHPLIARKVGDAHPTIRGIRRVAFHVFSARRISTQCFGMTPQASRTWWRQEKPQATGTVLSSRLRIAGNSRSSPIFMDRSYFA